MPKDKFELNYKEVEPFKVAVPTALGFQEVLVFGTASIFGCEVYVHNDVEPEHGIAVTDPLSRFKLSHDIKTAANKDVMSVLERVKEKAEVVFKTKKEYLKKCEGCYMVVQRRLLDIEKRERSLALDVCVLL